MSNDNNASMEKLLYAIHEGRSFEMQTTLAQAYSQRQRLYQLRKNLRKRGKGDLGVGDFIDRLDFYVQILDPETRLPLRLINMMRGPERDRPVIFTIARELENDPLLAAFGSQVADIRIPTERSEAPCVVAPSEPIDPDIDLKKALEL